MPFGSIFHNFDHVLITGDIFHLTFKNNFLTRIGFRLLGIPHIGLRLRARKIKKNLPDVTRMLDAGFGTGVYSFALANNVKYINAIDIDQEKVQYVKKVSTFKNIKFQKMDLTSLTFEDSYFDVIICSDVLEIIKNDEVAFSELARVLKKGGILIITVPYSSYKNARYYKQYGHVRPGYSKTDIQDLCTKNNMIILKTEDYCREIAERLLSINYKFSSNRLLLGLCFYPLYVTSIISDYLHIGNPNGIFFKIMKK